MKEISAGGVVYKRDGGHLYILIIEDRYKKIALPKGKLEKGETLEEAALREIIEETGITGKVVAPIEIVHYRFYHPELGQVDKEVHYFLVEAISGDPDPQLEEINSVTWATPTEAWSKQIESGYNNNNLILEKAFAMLGLPPENVSE